MSDYNGNILINDINFKSIDKKYWRDKIAYLSQDYQIYPLFILDNITLYENDNVLEMLELLGLLDDSLWETNNRFQYNTNWIKCFNDDQYIGLKVALDVFTANAKAGIFYREDGKGNIAYGIGVKAKALVLSGRGTTIIRIFGKEIKLGVSCDLFSVGGELYLVCNDKEDFGIIANGSTGLFGIGFIFRIKLKGM